MTFSSKTKEELSKLNNLANKDQVQAEFLGYLISDNASIENDMVKYPTESEYNINRFSKLLNNMNILDYEIDMSGNIFIISFNKDFIETLVNIHNWKIYITEVKNNEDYIKALVRGVFLGSGSMNNPEKVYHLELSLSTKESLELIFNLLQEM